MADEQCPLSHTPECSVLSVRNLVLDKAGSQLQGEGRPLLFHVSQEADSPGNWTEKAGPQSGQGLTQHPWEESRPEYKPSASHLTSARAFGVLVQCFTHKFPEPHNSSLCKGYHYPFLFLEEKTEASEW